MSKRMIELGIYYDFAEKCDDDYDIMVEVLKKYTKYKSGMIKMFLENCYLHNVLENIKKVTDEDIKAAKLYILNERQSLLKFQTKGEKDV